MGLLRIKELFFAVINIYFILEKFLNNGQVRKLYL